MIEPTLAAVAIAAVVAAALLRWFATRTHENLAKAEKHRNGFFEHAELIISDERTPPDLAIFVFALSTGLADRKLPYFMLLWPISVTSEKVRKDVNKVLQEMKELPEELRPSMEALRYHGLMAIALQSALVGRLLVRRIKKRAPRNDKNQRSDGDDSLLGRAAVYHVRHPPLQQGRHLKPRPI